MSWKANLSKKIEKYIRRDVHDSTQSLFLVWWRRFNPEILNEFEFTLDAEKDEAAQFELINLKGIILRDANIDKDDPNTDRVLFHLTTLIRELEQEVVYDNPTDEELEGVADSPEDVDRIKSIKP